VRLRVVAALVACGCAPTAAIAAGPVLDVRPMTAELDEGSSPVTAVPVRAWAVSTLARHPRWRADVVLSPAGGGRRVVLPLTAMRDVGPAVLFAQTVLLPGKPGTWRARVRLRRPGGAVVAVQERVLRIAPSPPRPQPSPPQPQPSYAPSYGVLPPPPSASLKKAPPLGAIGRRSVVSVDWTAGGRGAHGSGFIVAPRLVVTAAHVVAGGRVVRVRRPACGAASPAWSSAAILGATWP